MRRLRATLLNGFMLNLTLFSTLLLLKSLFPEIRTWQREVRRAEGFEAQRGDLVFELAKVLTQIMILINVMKNDDELIWVSNSDTIIEVVAMPPLVESNISCKPPDLPHRLISPLLIVAGDYFPYDDWQNRPVCEDPGFTGELLETPRKIVVLMLFGFEVAWNEINNWWTAQNVTAYIISTDLTIQQWLWSSFELFCFAPKCSWQCPHTPNSSVNRWTH